MTLKFHSNYELLYQRAFALDYRFGEDFFDLNGRISRRVLEENKELTIERLSDSTLRFHEKQINLTFSISSTRIHLVQATSIDVEELLPVARFAARAETLVKTVRQIFSTPTFSRIGYQETFLYPCQDSSSAQKAIQSLAIMQAPADLVVQIGAVDESSRNLTFIRKESLLRITILGFEQEVAIPSGVLQAAMAVPHEKSREQRRVLLDKVKAERMIKNQPQFGIQVSLDSFVTEPREVQVLDFIEASSSDIELVRPIIMK